MSVPSLLSTTTTKNTGIFSVKSYVEYFVESYTLIMCRLSLTTHLTITTQFVDNNDIFDGRDTF
jgi:hypothetical protein